MIPLASDDPPADDARSLPDGEAELLAVVFEDLPLAVALLAGEPLRIRYANGSAREFLGDLDPDLPIEELAAAIPSQEVAPDGELVDPRPLLERALGSGERIGPELYRMELPAGTRYLRLIAAPYGTGDDLPAVLVCAEDVSAQVISGEARRRFLEAAAHQFRTPLTPIMGYAQLLAQGDLEGEAAREAGEAILRAGRRLQALFDRLTALIRLEREPFPDPEDISIGDLLDQVSDTDPTLMEAVEMRGDPCVVVRCHPPSLVQVLYELLENGRRFGEPPVRVGWDEVGGTVELRVSDRGPGPAPGLLSDDVFLPDQAPEGQYVMPREMGLRLGLAHARALARLSETSLRLERGDDGWALALELRTVGGREDAP